MSSPRDPFYDYIQRGLQFLPQLLKTQNILLEDPSDIEALFHRAVEFHHLRFHAPELLMGICCAHVFGSNFITPEILTTRFTKTQIQACQNRFIQFLFPTHAERTMVMLIGDVEQHVDSGMVPFVTALNQQNLRTSSCCSGMAKDYPSYLPKEFKIPFIGFWMKGSYPKTQELRKYCWQQPIRPSDPPEDQFCLRIWRFIQSQIREKIDCQYDNQQLILRFRDTDRWTDTQILSAFEHLTKVLVAHKTDLQEGLETQAMPLSVIQIGPMKTAEISQRRYIELYTRRLDQWNPTHGQQELSLLLRFLAMHEIELGLWVEARRHLDAVLPIAREMKDLEAEAIIYNNRGAIYHEQQLFVEAIQEFERCLRIYEEIHDSREKDIMEVIRRLKAKLTKPH